MRHNKPNVSERRTTVPGPDKASALRHHHALNPRPDEVADPAFNGDNPFFDAQDLVQVKYEMLRRVREDGQAVSQASATFGSPDLRSTKPRLPFPSPACPAWSPNAPGQAGAQALRAGPGRARSGPGGPAQPQQRRPGPYRGRALRSSGPPPQRRAGIAETGKGGPAQLS